jgi:hypothetical protein
MKTKYSGFALPLCFLLLLAVLTVAFFALPKKSYAENEKRILSDPPAFSWQSLLDGTLTEQAQTYIADHFPLRDAFVGLHAYWEQLMLQNGDSGVYRGKDGYLFATQPKLDLDKLEKNISAIHAFADRSGLKTTWMIVPCAGYMLEDEMPPVHASYHDGDVIERAKTLCAKDTFIDARSALTNDSDAQLYYRTDHHLTSAGAKALYDAYCIEKKLAGHKFMLTTENNGFYGTAYSKSGLWLTKPDTLEIYAEPDGDYTVTITEGTNETNYGSLYFPSHLIEKDQYPVFLDGNHALVRIQNNRCQNGKKLLILKDSFAHCFATFLAAEYETIYMVDLRYHRSPVEEILQKEGIREMLVLYGAENLANSTDIAWLSLL